jgi:hypothetical protein
VIFWSLQSKFVWAIVRAKRGHAKPFKQPNKKNCMNTQEPPNNDNVTPTTIAEGLWQSAESPAKPIEQAKSHADAVPEADPEPYPMDEELEEHWDEMDGALVNATALMGEAWAASTIHGREAKLKGARSLAQQALERIDAGISLNQRQKLVEERAQLDKFAQMIGHADWDAMCVAHGYKKVEGQKSKNGAVESTSVAQDDQQAAAQPEVKTGRNKEPQRPYDRLLKEEFTSDGMVDFEAGYYSEQRIWSLYAWVKAFKKKYGRMPTKDDCRVATDKEMDEQHVRNKEKFDSTPRRGTYAKKP